MGVYFWKMWWIKKGYMQLEVNFFVPVSWNITWMHQYTVLAPLLFVIYPCLKDCTFPIITKEITVGLLLDKCTK